MFFVHFCNAFFGNVPVNTASFGKVFILCMFLDSHTGFLLCGESCSDLLEVNDKTCGLFTEIKYIFT